MDLSFKGMQPSLIAFAAMLNVLDGVLGAEDTSVTASERNEFVQRVERCLFVETSTMTGDGTKSTHMGCGGSPFIAAGGGKWMLNRAREMLVLISHRSRYFEHSNTVRESMSTIKTKNVSWERVLNDSVSSCQESACDERRDESEGIRSGCVFDEY